jgi:hypothetical protein
VFASTRCYSLKLKNENWETKIAGIPRNSISFKEFKQHFYNVNYMNDHYIRITEFRQQLPNNKNAGWEKNKKEKLIKLNTYEKRKFSKDKKETKSLTKLNEKYI